MCTFLFRGSFSNPNPGIRSARLSTISPTTKTFFRREKKGQTPNEAKRKSDCLLDGWGYTGRRAPARRSGEGSGIPLPRSAAVPRGRSRPARGTGRGEATNLPGNVSSDWHLLRKERGRGKRGDASSSCGSGERCGDPGPACRRCLPGEGLRPPLASLHRLFHTSPFPPLPSREIQSRQEATSVHVYFSLRRATTTYTPFFSFFFFFWKDPPETGA